jgi:hypothetical protein
LGICEASSESLKGSTKPGQLHPSGEREWISAAHACLIKARAPASGASAPVSGVSNVVLPEPLEPTMPRRGAE